MKKKAAWRRWAWREGSFSPFCFQAGDLQVGHGLSLGAAKAMPHPGAPPTRIKALGISDLSLLQRWNISHWGHCSHQTRVLWPQVGPFGALPQHTAASDRAPWSLSCGLTAAKLPFPGLSPGQAGRSLPGPRSVIRGDALSRADAYGLVEPSCPTLGVRGQTPFGKIKTCRFLHTLPHILGQHLLLRIIGRTWQRMRRGYLPEGVVARAPAHRHTSIRVALLN